MSNQKKVFLGLLLIVTALAVYLVKDYFGVIALSVLIVLMFNPVYKRFLAAFKGNKGIATTLVSFVILLSFIIPIGLIGFFTVYQVEQVAHDLKEANFQASDIGRVTNTFLDDVNETLKNNSIDYEITPEQVNSSLNQGLRSGGNAMLDYGRSLGGKIPEYITNLILLIVLVTFLFPAQTTILDAINKISPLSVEITKKYLSKMSAMARSMINGTFVVALVQALIGGLMLWILGVPYALFFTFVLLIASVIPLLGSGLVLIPISLVLLATGNIVGGVILLLLQFIVISNIDNILRPKLVEEDARIPEAITLLGIIAGLSMFGILGLIFGPVIMVIALTTYEIYLNYYAIAVKNYLNKD